MNSNDTPGGVSAEVRPLDYLRALRSARFGDRLRLSGHAIKSTLHCLLSHADSQTMTAWPSLDTIAEESELSVSTVARAIAAARDSGWLETSRRSRTSVTVYRLTIPTGHGAKSHGAKSQGDGCDLSPGSVRPVTMTGATGYGDHRSDHLSDQGTDHRTGESAADAATPLALTPVEGKKSGKRVLQGTRVPGSDATLDEVKAFAERWKIPLEHSQWMLFVDHWRSQSGHRGVKADWGATWRNWLRRDFGGNSGGGGAARFRQRAGDWKPGEEERKAELIPDTAAERGRAERLEREGRARAAMKRVDEGSSIEDAAKEAGVSEDDIAHAYRLVGRFPPGAVPMPAEARKAIDALLKGAGRLPYQQPEDET